MDVYGTMALVKDIDSNCLSLDIVYHEPWQEKGNAIPLWRHYLYYDFHKYYKKLSNTFHCFESDDCFYGLNFVDQRSAQTFMDVLLKKSSKECVKSSSNTTTSGNSFKSLLGLATKGKKGASKRLTVDDMSDPTGFQHLIHIGFNPLTGAFEPHNIPPEWAIFFEKAGLAKKDLEDKQTANCVAQFVNENHLTGAKATDQRTLQTPPPPPHPHFNSNSNSNSHPHPPSPPPPPQPTSTLPSVPSDRANLMESIRKSSIQGLKAVPTQPRDELAPTKHQPAGSDLMASMLAKALADRKQKVVEDSDNDDDDDW